MLFNDQFIGFVSPAFLRMYGNAKCIFSFTYMCFKVMGKSLRTLNHSLYCFILFYNNIKLNPNQVTYTSLIYPVD